MSKIINLFNSSNAYVHIVVCGVLLLLLLISVIWLLTMAYYWCFKSELPYCPQDDSYLQELRYNSKIKKKPRDITGDNPFQNALITIDIGLGLLVLYMLSFEELYKYYAAGFCRSDDLYSFSLAVIALIIALFAILYTGNVKNYLPYSFQNILSHIRIPFWLYLEFVSFVIETVVMVLFSFDVAEFPKDPSVIGSVDAETYGLSVLIVGVFFVSLLLNAVAGIVVFGKILSFLFGKKSKKILLGAYRILCWGKYDNKYSGDLIRYQDTNDDILWIFREYFDGLKKVNKRGDFKLGLGKRTNPKRIMCRIMYRIVVPYAAVCFFVGYFSWRIGFYCIVGLSIIIGLVYMEIIMNGLGEALSAPNKITCEHEWDEDSDYVRLNRFYFGNYFNFVIEKSNCSLGAVVVSNELGAWLNFEAKYIRLIHVINSISAYWYSVTAYYSTLGKSERDNYWNMVSRIAHNVVSEYFKHMEDKPDLQTNPSAFLPLLSIAYLSYRDMDRHIHSIFEYYTKYVKESVTADDIIFYKNYMLYLNSNAYMGENLEECCNDFILLLEDFL